MSDERAVFIAVDVKGYSRTAPFEHRAIQRDLDDILRNAAFDAQLSFDRWRSQPQGDGILFMAPAEYEPRYIDSFIAQVLKHLDQRNRDRVPDARLRLRIGLAQGPSSIAPTGFTGDAPILACRLQGAQAIKDILAGSGADLVLAITDQLFTDNVQGGRSAVNAADFIRIQINEDKISDVAWIWLPKGHLSATPPAARPGKSQPPPGGTASGGRTQTVTDLDIAHSAVTFGDNSPASNTVGG